MRKDDYEAWMKNLGWVPKPCLRCGSDDLDLWDLGDDGGYEITCKNCRAQHYGAFAEDTGKSWNKAQSIDELNTWGKPQKEWSGPSDK